MCIRDSYKIAQAENLEPTKDDINAEIAAVASASGLKPGDVRRRLKDEGRLPDLEERLLQDRIFGFLKQRAGLADEKPPSEEAEAAEPAVTEAA